MQTGYRSESFGGADGDARVYRDVGIRIGDPDQPSWTFHRAAAILSSDNDSRSRAPKLENSADVAPISQRNDADLDSTFDRGGYP